MSDYTETAVRHALACTAETLPDTDDAWQQFTRAEHSHRRTRHRRGAIAAAFLVAAIAVQTNVLPLPGWAPGIAVADTWSAFADGPVRGNLSSDTAWLADFRTRVHGLHDGDGLWRVADRSSIHVVYAGDVAGHRLALVYVPLRLGLITDADVIWYEGRANASPSQMVMSGNDDASVPVATLLQDDSDTGGFAVVVGAPGTDVSISGSATYAATGVVEHHQTTMASNGVGVAVLPPSEVTPAVTTHVAHNGHVIYDGPLLGSWRAISAYDISSAILTAAMRGARGPALDPIVLRTFIAAALNSSHLTLQNVTVNVSWSGTIDRQPAVLITLQPAGGGVLAFAFHNTGTSSYSIDLRLLLPAAGANQRPIAWRLRGQNKDQTNTVIVTAPTGAATAVVTVADGTTHSVALDASGHGTTDIPVNQSAVVTTYAANGTVLASTPVPEIENDEAGLPGDTPQTRIVG